MVQDEAGDASPIQETELKVEFKVIAFYQILGGKPIEIKPYRTYIIQADQLQEIIPLLTKRLSDSCGSDIIALPITGFFEIRKTETEKLIEKVHLN